MMQLTTTQAKVLWRGLQWSTGPSSSFYFQLAVCTSPCCFTLNLSKHEVFGCLDAETWITYIRFLSYSLSNYANHVEMCQSCIWMRLNWCRCCILTCQRVSSVQAKQSIQPPYFFLHCQYDGGLYTPTWNSLKTYNVICFCLHNAYSCHFSIHILCKLIPHLKT